MVARKILTVGACLLNNFVYGLIDPSQIKVYDKKNNQSYRSANIQGTSLLSASAAKCDKWKLRVPMYVGTSIFRITRRLVLNC